MARNLGFFEYRDGELCCEDVPVEEIARTAGTPVYIYSTATLRDRFQAIARAFEAVDTTICFSVKGCGSLGVLGVMQAAGSGFDVVSGGEIFRVVQAGGDPSRIVYAGVGKTDAELRYALEQQIRMFNVESEAELATIDRIAGEVGATAPVALRINPDVDPKTHAKTTTGKKENKFGIDPETAGRLTREIGRYAHVSLQGVDAHIGSPVNSVEPYELAACKLSAFVAEHRSDAAPLDTMNTGGGFGLFYRDEPVPAFDAYAAAIVPHVQQAGCRLIVEPGRSIAGNAGILLGTVQYRKTSGKKTFVILDAGMNDLVRVALYDAYHFLWPARSKATPAHAAFGGTEDPGWAPTDVVGPICESSDVFCRDRPLPPLDRGDRVALFSAGAYGFTQACTYNAQPLPAEVLVDGASWRVIRERQTWEDLVRGETV